MDHRTIETKSHIRMFLSRLLLSVSEYGLLGACAGDEIAGTV